MARNKKHKTRAIVAGYIEKVNSRIFDGYQKEITDMTRGYQGLYALYKRNNLYYVGLARNLKGRIRHHLKDRHQGEWTHFSLYVIKRAGHIKELESLLLRIAYPKGNSQKGKLKNSKNLLPILKRQVKQKIKEDFDDIFKDVLSPGKKKKAKIGKTGKRPLQGCFPGGKMIYANYKDERYKAWVNRNGLIRVNGKRFDSPSMAGIEVTKKKTINGWKFWKYKNKDGELVYIDKLR
jgi:hypothetical protein